MKRGRLSLAHCGMLSLLPVGCNDTVSVMLQVRGRSDNPGCCWVKEVAVLFCLVHGEVGGEPLSIMPDGEGVTLEGTVPVDHNGRHVCWNEKHAKGFIMVAGL